MRIWRIYWIGFFASWEEELSFANQWERLKKIEKLPLGLVAHRASHRNLCIRLVKLQKYQGFLGFVLFSAYFPGKRLDLDKF
jgi:hypothetical protein